MAFTIRRNLRISFFCCLRRIAPPSSGRERQTVTINKKIEMTVQTLPATVPDSVSATLRVVMKPVESIHPYENNPRYNDSAVPYVKNSIQEFGFKVPIIVDEAGSIVCGHTRYKAAPGTSLSTMRIHRPGTTLIATGVTTLLFLINPLRHPGWT